MDGVQCYNNIIIIVTHPRRRLLCTIQEYVLYHLHSIVYAYRVTFTWIIIRETTNTTMVSSFFSFSTVVYYATRGVVRRLLSQLNSSCVLQRFPRPINLSPLPAIRHLGYHHQRGTRDRLRDVRLIASESPKGQTERSVAKTHT